MKASDGFQYITELLDSVLDTTRPVDVKGRVVQVVGTIIKAIVPGVKIGELCTLKNPGEEKGLLAEVVGFSKEAALLTPLGSMIGVSSTTEAITSGKTHRVLVCRAVGPSAGWTGRPALWPGPIDADESYPVYGSPPNPMKRKMIQKPIALGVRALDGFLTCGEGQRMGIFAAAGGGKSTLLAAHRSEHRSRNHRARAHRRARA